MLLISDIFPTTFQADRSKLPHFSGSLNTFQSLKPPHPQCVGNVSLIYWKNLGECEQIFLFSVY